MGTSSPHKGNALGTSPSSPLPGRPRDRLRATVRSIQAACLSRKACMRSSLVRRGALAATVPSPRTRRLRFFTFLRVTSTVKVDAPARTVKPLVVWGCSRLRLTGLLTLGAPHQPTIVDALVRQCVAELWKGRCRSAARLPAPRGESIFPEGTEQRALGARFRV